MTAYKLPRLLTLLMTLALLLSAASALAAPPQPTASATPDQGAFQRLQTAVGGGAQVSIKRGTGVASFVRLPRTGAALALPGDTTEARAGAFFQQYGSLFGLRETAELALARSVNDAAGGTHLAYTQAYRGIPVFGADLHAHFDAAGRLTSANGTFVPDIAVDTQPSLSADRAAEIASAAVAAAQPASPARPFAARGTELVIYRTGLVQGVPGSSFLAYHVEVADGATVREFVFVDAQSGAILDRFSGVNDTLHRQLYNQQLDAAHLVWEEGDAFPTANTDWNNEINGAGETYNLFASMTNGAWLSYNNADAIMKTVNDDPSISCPNANWNGVSTNYCTGVSGDDTVSHEWAHAYTEYTHNLIYAWQPGALNESYSDIWGEVVDFLNNRGSDTPGTLRSTDGSKCSTLDGDAKPLSAKKDNTYRWLSGEDDPAFGAPIRDLYRPECHLDPGSVTSSRYACSTSDGGGVHTNSGVPNHAFALLVDGGTSNGQTITGIGLTKAAHIYWQAQRLYQGPTTDFADHADALDAACADLIGTPLYELKTTGAGWGATTPAITAADCSQIAKAALAVAFRTAPSCSFTPMFNPNPPALCTTAGAGAQNWLFQDFETGLGAWTISQTPVNPATWTPRDWQTVTALPDGRAGSAAYGPDPVVGDCSNDLDNGVIAMTSPLITVPANAAAPVRMAFDHLVSMEIDYDGGNLKASVNGGAFALVPASAFTFNAYSSALATTDNDNPLAGEVAWTGGDGGAVSSQWGQSQLDLSKIGVTPGSTVRFRWEVGTDGCNGWDGWYVDDVRVYSCAPCSTPSQVTGLSISAPDAATVQLTWPAASGATQYEVWQAVNTPYFDPTGKSCASPAPYACTTTASLTYLTAELGDAGENHTYIVRGANACGQVAGNSARKSEFDFALVR